MRADGVDMRSEREIRKALSYIEEKLKSGRKTGHDQSHSIGYRNALQWVLEEE